MDILFKDLLWDYVIVYLDDIIIYSKTWEEHLCHLREVFRRLARANWKIVPKKCEFAQPGIPYLGHIVDRQGIRPGDLKTKAIDEFPTLTNVTGVRAFLGLAGYYRKFVKGFSRIAHPLTQLTKEMVPFIWTSECQSAMAQLQAILTTQPVLVHPNFDLPFLLQTDWSTTGMGAVLAQRTTKGEKVVAYASRQLRGAEVNYSATDGECLAVVWGVKYFRPFLYGHRFTLQTDHKALSWLMTTEGLQGRLARWALSLQEYMITIEYKTGSSHANADALSRCSLPSEPSDRVVRDPTLP